MWVTIEIIKMKRHISLVLQKFQNVTLWRGRDMKAKTVAFVALMAALANVMSIPPLAIPIPLGTFTSSIHFFQLAIFLCGILAGPWAGFLSGAVGSLYMGIMRIPFIIGGIAILGACTGLFAKKFRPAIACLLAWLVQAPYILVTDYIWFTYFMGNSQAVALSIMTPIIVTLGLEAVICAFLADVIVHYVRKAGITL
jgi:uncharacterized membrane protein